MPVYGALSFTVISIINTAPLFKVYFQPKSLLLLLSPSPPMGDPEFAFMF